MVLTRPGEGYHAELKRSFDKFFSEEVHAFANSGGGRILLGVADNGVIKGINTGNAMRSRVQDIPGQIEPRRHTKVRLKIEHLQHQEIPDYPEVALREAIVNAACHRDYFDKRANVQIDVFADRVVISNPGGLPSGLSPEEFGTKSVARNPRIASMLHRIDYIEKVGTGIMRIRQSVAEHGGTELDLRYNDFFTATFRSKTFIPEDGVIGIKAESGAESGAESQEHRVLSLLRAAPLSKSELAFQLGLNSVTGALNRSVNALLEKELIERTIPDKPQSRLQKYRLTAQARALGDKGGTQE